MTFDHRLFSYHLLILASYDQTVQYQQLMDIQMDHFSQTEALTLYIGRFLITKSHNVYIFLKNYLEICLQSLYFF